MRPEFCKLFFGLALMLQFASSVAVAQDADLKTNQRQPERTDNDEKWSLVDHSTSTGFVQQTHDSVPRYSIRKVGSSLAIVLGAFALVSLAMRRPKTSGQTTPLIETLEQIHLTPKVKLHLVRFGQRLLVLHVSPGAVQRIAEITDPAEVAQMLGDSDAVQVAETLNQHPSVEELLQAVGKVQPLQRSSGTGGLLA